MSKPCKILLLLVIAQASVWRDLTVAPEKLL